MSSSFLSLCARLALTLPFAAPAVAQSHSAGRLPVRRIAALPGGTYMAGDKIGFDLIPSRGHFLLRFDRDPEVFVLYSDRASLGGRVLKYDTGETAIRVSGWGGLTLYTAWRPNGLPAMRTGDPAPLSPAPVSVAGIEQAAVSESRRLARLRRLTLAFTADWNALETSAELCVMAMDAMENAARGIGRFARGERGRKAVGQRIDAVTLATGRRSGVALHGKTLVVTFDPDRGYAGRASSLAVARALGRVLWK